MKKYLGVTTIFSVAVLLSWYLFHFIHDVEQTLFTEPKVEYSEVTVNEYKRPKFNKDDINDFIDKYIDENECQTFDYNVYQTDNNLVTMYLNCGNAESIIYDYKEKKVLSISDIVKNTDEFSSSVKRLLDFKYPKFVTNQVSILDGVYKINENELVGYYTTEDYGNVSIKINNNEIKDMMSYTQKYDEEYENEVFTLDPTKKTVAFSFDDGPSNYDLTIIDNLVDAHYSATFFMVGNRINNFKKSALKIKETGMEAGNHSYDHKYMGKMSKASVESTINKTSNIYKEVTGDTLNIFRPPYGSVKSSYLTDLGLSSIIWSVDTLDWKYRNADSVYEKIMACKDGDIILMHSLYPSTRDAVERAIPELYKRGFQVVSVSKLAELKGKTLEPGKAYWSIRG